MGYRSNIDIEKLKVIRLSLRQTDLQTYRGVIVLHFTANNTICDCSRSNQRPQTDNRDCSLRAHLFLSYQLIKVP